MFGQAKNKALLVTLMVLFAAFAVLLPLAEDADAKKKKKRETFSSSTPITISDRESGSATPYPLITVVDAKGKILDVNVSLEGLTHGRPDDLDVMVVGPRGQCAKVLSDAGDTGDLNGDGIDLILDDEASSSPPDDGQLTSGKFKPANYEGADQFPKPAPTDCDNTKLSVFDGTKARGDWKLYVVDDTAGFGGQIAKHAINTKGTGANNGKLRR